jgi:hypothetical protein
MNPNKAIVLPNRVYYQIAVSPMPRRKKAGIARRVLRRRHWRYSPSDFSTGIRLPSSHASEDAISSQLHGMATIQDRFKKRAHTGCHRDRLVGLSRAPGVGDYFGGFQF